MNSELCMFCLFMFIPTGAKQGEGVENCAVCFVEVSLYNLCTQFYMGRRIGHYCDVSNKMLNVKSTCQTFYFIW